MIDVQKIYIDRTRERAEPSRTVMASRVARDDVNRSERVQKKRIIYKWIKMIFVNTN